MRKKNIIIVGAGFAGITTTLKIEKKLGRRREEYDVILIDRMRHHLYTPALYEIASIPRENAPDAHLKTSILIPFEEILARTRIRFLCDEFIALEEEEKHIILREGGKLSYEFLVFALGSETNYFSIPGLKEHSFPLKTFHDAIRLRNTIETLVAHDIRAHIIVGGGGSTGVELIAEFINFICTIRKKNTSGKKTCEITFTLIEASPEILPGFDTWIIEKTKKRLAYLGIRIKTSAAIVEINDTDIIFGNGERMRYDVVIWTGGVKGPEALRSTNLPLSPKGALEVNEFLQVNNTTGIFAVGDTATYIHPKTNKPLVWNVPAAEAEGRFVAQNILRAITEKPLKKFTPLKRYPFILAVGNKYAIADLIVVRFWGLLGWVAKEFVELRYLLFILPMQTAFTIWFKGLKYFTSND